MCKKQILAKNRENFWKNIGDYYYKRNTTDSIPRRKWLAKIILFYRPKSVLEIGCNEGANLREIHKLNPKIKLAGIDINANAVNYAKSTLPDANIICGSIYDIDKYFKEKEFDLIFSMGVLIHIPPEMLRDVRDKIIYLAKNAIVHCEEHSINPEIKSIDKTTGKNIGHRWSHDYYDLYKNYNIKIYNNVVDAGGGAHHLMVITKDMSLRRRFYFWCLRFLLLLTNKGINKINKWQKRNSQ